MRVFLNSNGGCRVLFNVLVIIILFGWVTMWWRLHTIHDTMHPNINSNIVMSFNDNLYESDNDTIHYPSLVIVGPPKSGTTTITHTFGNMSDWIRFQNNNGENHYFNGANKYRCIPLWNQTQWSQFIEQWETYQISYLSLGVHIKFLCPVREYLKMIKNMLKGEHREHFDDGKHYYIESSPSYQRNPLIPITFALYLPHTKLLQIIRDPIKFTWSWNWHFSSAAFKNNINKMDPVQEAERWIEWKLYRDTVVNETRYQLTRYCTKLKQYGDTKQRRREFMMKYLHLRFVENKIEPKVRRDGFVWAAIYLPTFLFYLHVYDEVYGYNEWNQFKVIQFEWFYKAQNTVNGLAMIRKWVMGNNWNNNNFMHHEMNKFRKLPKKEHRATNIYSNDFVTKMTPAFKDCNDVLQNIVLNKRPNLLIGDWIDWEY